MFCVFFLFFQLEEVMETETYKNAKMILERFDPDSKKNIVRFSFVFTLSNCLWFIRFVKACCCTLFSICRSLNQLQLHLR